jgi:hypothetical protein
MVRDVNVPAELHPRLGEVAELVREHGLELGEVEHVDEPQADEEVLADWPEQGQQRARIRDGRVDVVGDVYRICLPGSGLEC